MGMDSYSFFENVSDLNPLTLVFYILFQFFSNLQLAHFQEYTHIQNVSIFISLYIYYCICYGADTRRVLSQKWNEKINVSGQLLRILSTVKKNITITMQLHPDYFAGLGIRVECGNFFWWDRTGQLTKSQA